MIAELAPGYEGYVASTPSFVAVLVGAKDVMMVPQHGIEATLVILEAPKAILLLQIVMVNSILLH